MNGYIGNTNAAKTAPKDAKIEMRVHTNLKTIYAEQAQSEGFNSTTEWIIHNMNKLAQKTVIFTAEEIAENTHYAKIMTRINELYGEHGYPVSTDKTTTTGEHKDQRWDDSYADDADGVYFFALVNKQREEVLRGLELWGNGGISYYYQTEDFSNFVEAALAELEEYEDEIDFNV